MKNKILAFYLPQFHRFKENDIWWGEGFTEWTNTKKATPLYRGHYQPKEPMDDKYYNLLNDDVKIWQAELAKKYDIYGFCYYHYWFKGKKLMEKPLEQMLANKDIELNFCISWANEPWTRNWNGLSSEVIMPQEYGNKKDWIEHFEYLLQFFKDDRYIKIDNKPMLLIYRVNSIDNHEEMFALWNEMCVKNGFDGIYIVETITRFQKKSESNISNAVCLFEPSYTTANEYNKFSRGINCAIKIVPAIKRGWRYLKTNNYDMIWKKILKRKVKFENKKVYLGAFVSWDNTARRGKNASIIEGSNPQKFKKYFTKLLTKAKENESEYIFINAWNEWAEGTYLEPDKKYEYSYLNAIKEAIEKFENGK